MFFLPNTREFLQLKSCSYFGKKIVKPRKFHILLSPLQYSFLFYESLFSYGYLIFILMLLAGGLEIKTNMSKALMNLKYHEI
jgi:hypothetical protein